MSECAGSIDSIKRVKLILSEEEQLDDQGLTVLSAADKTGTAIFVLCTHTFTDCSCISWVLVTSDLCPRICGLRCDRAMGAPAGAVVQRAAGSSAVAQTQLWPLWSHGMAEHCDAWARKTSNSTAKNHHQRHGEQYPRTKGTYLQSHLESDRIGYKQI